MKRILITGYIGFENFGDEALLHVLLEDLTNLGVRRKDIAVTSDNPAHTIQFHGVAAVDRWSVLDVSTAIYSSDALIFIGGLFQDRTSLKSFLYYYSQLFLAATLKKEIIFYGIGIGPIKSKIAKYLFNTGIKSVRFLTVRDTTSAMNTIYGNSTPITCDPVWSIKPNNSFQIKYPQINWELPILGISLRNDKNLKATFLSNLAEKVARVVSSMKSWQIVLIPCEPSEDLSILYQLQLEIQRKLSEPVKIFLFEDFNTLPIEQQSGVLASCDVMVGMRFHSLLVPLSNGKPVFGLIYDDKVKNLLTFANQTGISFKDIIDQPWNYFWQNLEHSSKMAMLAKERATKLHAKNIELLIGFLSLK